LAGADGVVEGALCVTATDWLAMVKVPDRDAVPLLAVTE
jgi:hypothetical protein